MSALRVLAYAQVLADLRKLLKDGSLQAGERLPSETELGDQYGVSRVTIRRAYQQLVEEGLVHRQRGRGTFARRSGSADIPHFRSYGEIEDLLALARNSSMRIIQPLRLVSNPDAANRLGLHGIEVASTEVIRFVDEKQPYAFQRIAFPPALLGPLEKASKSWTKAGPVSFVAVINALIPSGIASAVQEITAIECPADVAPILKCDVGKSVLLVSRMYVDFEGNAVELVASCYHPERYSYRIELERAPIANDRGSGL